MRQDIDVTAHDAVAALDAAEWDGLANPGGGRPVDPFTTHRFLAALEMSGSVGGASGWQPHPLVARLAGRAIAAAPLYVKSHSQGEYIFDFAWADAFERAGGDYYPKLQIAVPFTPATGRRFLTAEGLEDVGRSALMQGALALAERNDLSSVHATFCTATEAAAGAAVGFLPRSSQQFHWHNRGYADFEAFLADLSSRKRKMIRKEREAAQGFGGTIHVLTGSDLRPDHWDAFWRFYQDTGARKWGRPYLTRAFFTEIHRTMADDILLVMAEREGHWIAGALNFIGRDTLFGRYWGSSEHHPFLHFELCYYQAMDWAIAQGLARVEAGAQGEHKLARGYLPAETHSLHWIANPGFRRAVAQFLDAERAAVDEEMEVLTSYGPFRKGGAEEEGI
ncbi:GNAT family N-acetyltransferase [Falsirhodobacter halotolerans]|uniref:GNAT family N-acetyltransferase n=1 Tax=Falsirhodobacter halotolerans TaxID=1146892 RepID=UPI001FD1031D|nr:GNAT family N-acetyltransferase [Falsirhodobacter halotolerans]MCJ8140662.1 GNAT family N-acetyltransferase [Falsirhodobacter halotolerans]